MKPPLPTECVRSSDSAFSRREFLRGSTAAWAAAALAVSGAGAEAGELKPYSGKLCFFSKPLASMDWARLAKNVKRLGFDGVDLTVRHEEGHVMPERVHEDLPKAAATLKDQGLDLPMITTSLTSANDSTAVPILSTAGKLKIPYFKPGYYYYKLIDVHKELAEAGVQFRGLARLGQQYGVQVGYHNHEHYIGAPVWDMASVIEPLDPKWVGFYFDARHATAEGGAGAWKISTHLVLPRLKMVAVKDFYWEKTAKGWREVDCPLGQGMVDWKYFFHTLAQAGFHGPISLHMEYDVPGATQTEREDNILATVQRDLDFLKAQVREAYGPA